MSLAYTGEKRGMKRNSFPDLGKICDGAYKPGEGDIY